MILPIAPLTRAPARVHSLFRDVLGLYRVDPVAKTVRLRFSDLKLDWCEGRRPTPDGPVELRWRKTGGQLRYSVVVPSGYQVEVETLGTMQAVRVP